MKSISTTKIEINDESVLVVKLFIGNIPRKYSDNLCNYIKKSLIDQLGYEKIIVIPMRNDTNIEFVVIDKIDK